MQEFLNYRGIMKLYAKKPVPDFETIKSELIGKVKRDNRSKLIDEALINKLKKKYNVQESQPALAYFEAISCSFASTLSP